MALRHPADARPGGLLGNRDAPSTARSSILISATTKTYKSSNEGNKKIPLALPKFSGKKHPSQSKFVTPRVASARSEADRMSVASVDSSTRANIVQAEILEDRVWEIQNEIDWRKSFSANQSFKGLQESSKPDNWMNNAREIYMKNRYRTQAMDSYSGQSADVFSKSTTPVTHRRVRKEFGRYGEALHLAKTTMRGNF
jgi:hypothetical protein